MKGVFSLLILVQISGIISHPCPEQCMCKLIGAQAEGLRVKCEGHIQEIKEINIDEVSVELVQLDLCKNEILSIEANIFKNLTNLKRLDLSENKISSIDEDCFNGLENLEKLDLSKNQISTIDTYAFKQLSNLRRLDLSGNQINTVMPSLFNNLLNLDRLKLSGNSLTTLKEGTFHRLKLLKQLDLSNNPWKCDCELYWFRYWLHNTSIRLSPPAKCASPVNIKGQLIKKFRLLENFHCQWASPSVELRPIQNQVVFAGDSITLKCRAPSIIDDKNARLNWLWYPNTTTEIFDLDVYKDPQSSLPNIKIENRYLSDSGIVDSSLSIIPVKDEHNGQWNCFLTSMNGNRSKEISVIVISEQTRYCPLAVTRNNKGMYTWPRTVVGWKAELPCEGNLLSNLMQVSLRATYHCNATGFWENLNTDMCPFVSHTTKVLEQFSKVNLSLTLGNLLETAKRFKNYTSEGVKLTDPIEINFITLTIENYLSFLNDEKELGNMLINVVEALLNLPKEMLKTAEINYKSCSRLIKATETITEFTPTIQMHKKNMALEEFRVKRDSFTGLMCTWYTNLNPTNDLDKRSLHCTTNNRTIPVNTKDKIIEASIQLPATLLQNVQDAIVSHKLMISMYNDNRLFPKIINIDNMDISTSVIGSKLIGLSLKNLSDPIYIMLRAPLHHYVGKKPKPVVWDETLNESGGWISDGCQLSNLFNNLIVFQCNRLGYYGLLQDVSYLSQDGFSINGPKFKYSNPAIYIGTFITITCLLVTSVTYIVCYSSINMPKKVKHCVINTWFAMALLSFLYSIGIQQTENIQICQSIGLVLHYLSLSCLLWMATSASNMYKKLSKSDIDIISDDEPPDQPIPKPLLGLYLVGWGIALIICGISGAINLREYAGYSYCFLTNGAALAALFIPAGILIVYIIILHLLIRCAIRNVDTNAQLSESTQATENMDLELLEPNISPVDRNSAHSTQTVSSDIEDSEHSQIAQLNGLTLTLILYLISWFSAAAVTRKPFNSYIPFVEIIFAIVYAISTSSLGIFIFLFYGIARNDVRSQWLKMRCWLQRKKNRCCRTRSVSDANPVIPTQQPLVQNIVAPLSNSQATQVTSDTNSVSSSRQTANRSHTCNTSKITDLVSNQDPAIIAAKKVPNINLLVLHRQQYRSNNSVTTYTEQGATCVEMFYNPHQSGVARKFFKKQRRHTKHNNLGPRKQGDGGGTSDGGSCISIPRPAVKVESNIERSILSSSAKVNNTNIHVELKAISDTKNVNILSDSGGSISEERNVPMRFVIGQDNLVRNVKKINNDCTMQEEFTRNNALPDSPRRNSCQRLYSKSVTVHESDPEMKTDEERYLKSVSQQCSLEYSSEIDSTTQMTSERSDQNLPDICETAEMLDTGRCSKMNDSALEIKTKPSTRWLFQSMSMHNLPLNHTKLFKKNHRSSLNDITTKNCEYSKQSFTNLTNTSSCNLFDIVPESKKLNSKSEQSLTEINSFISDNAFALVNVEPSVSNDVVNMVDTSNCSDECDFHLLQELHLSNLEQNNSTYDLTKNIESNFYCLTDIASSENLCTMTPNFESVSETENIPTNTIFENVQEHIATDLYVDASVNHLSIVKKETSV
ncbi:PREDICTED: adhesion G protein-coupled receptor A3 isoform X1 [Polistes canadensis]|uniref:adhesion G protein-coupled receptor A3 isoform X1 n=1 Tax=Polistes canadensis TaxID=91411 RepID=UPI000718B5E5|nr:PREDICTED: adhesion G protein-coupled receptor A3 isoform X1 [Polistes canadensis]